ncbi:hypothetical protein Dimus_028515 [Dionaea muscipula]
MKGGSSNSNRGKQQQHQLGSNMVEENYKESIESNHPKQQARSPHLSGAYIRTLVKQLTTTSTGASNSSSRTKSTDSHVTCMSEQGGGGRGDDVANLHGQRQQPQAPHKKQVRRRLHTSRPYQERLLNMAEARKEIVAALKFHRASMKLQQQQQQQQHALPGGNMIGISSPMKEEDTDHQYLMSMNKYSPHPSSYHNNTHSCCNSSNKWSYDPPPPQCGRDRCPWPMAPLPSQSLGLNLSLNFQDLDPNFIHLLHQKEVSASASASTAPLFSPSSSPPPPPPPPPLSCSTTMEVCMDDGGNGGGGGGGDGGEEYSSSTVGSGGLYLHQALDEEEMAEIRSVGEQHHMEWSDALNLVTSAWWSNFLSKMDLEGNQDHHKIFINPSEPSANYDHMSQEDDCFSSTGSDDYPHHAAPPNW